MRNYDRTDDDYFLWYPENTNDIYKVETDKIKCQNCLGEDNENITVDTKQEADSVVTTTVTVNGDVVKVKETTTKKGLFVDKEGKIIKNN